MTLLIKIPTRKINRKKQFLQHCLVAFLTVIMLLGSVKAFAVEKPCSLTINITSSDNTVVESSLSIGLCKIASLNGEKYELTDFFADSGISIECISNKTSSNHYTEIYRYITENNIPYETAVTNSENSAVFSNLDEGIYLVFCEHSQSLTFSPYIVFLPSDINGNLTYDVISEPKTIIVGDNVKNISVKKLWNDNNNYAEKRPESITITLKRDGKAYQTTELNEKCNWEYTFENLPANSTYAVEEEKVDFYEPSYKGSADSGFTVTNTLITDSPIMNFVKTGINTGIIPIVFFILISAFVLIVLSRKRIKK